MEQKYLGITPYDEDDCFEFAGRSEETWALYDRIIRNEYTVYYAASGEGKSSLIRAGLIPILRRRDFFPVYIVFEDKELEYLSSFENAIIKRMEIEEKRHNVSYKQSTWSESYFDKEQSERLKDSLWWRLRNYCFRRGDKELKPLFIFDQFEEVFTKANYDWTNHFFTWLEEISTDYLPNSLQEMVNFWGIDMPTQKNFKALFSFRTEYLGDLDYWSVQKHFLPSLQENRMCLKPLTPKGAREIINLNETSLGIYAEQIIQGCAEAKSNTDNENQPCVYALILSVVCQTLSELSDDERKSLLNQLSKSQDETIDDILLKFYKGKLKDVGLDYGKDEKIIAAIEDALVDEKGKRSRRDMDEDSLQSISKWIERLSNKKNGLIKIVGRKEINGVTVNTVEFPHDRLCKAIDASRKERQGKVAWKLNRQMEWMQFGINTAVVGVIAFLWNYLMPVIKPAITGYLYNESDVLNLFFGKYLNGGNSELKGNSLDESFSSLCLMVLLVLFIPLITTFIVRKTKKWQILSFITSFLGTLLLGLLWFRNGNITFTNNYVSIFTVIGFFACAVSLIISLFRLRKIFSQDVKTKQDVSLSYWSLWGGYFLFACYLFYEFLYRTTFGINEPIDSAWALFVLPILYTFWAIGFFCMKIDNKLRKELLYGYFIAVIVMLALLWVISAIPYYNAFKQNYGILSSAIIIVLWVVSSVVIICKTKSNSKYYPLSISKRMAATVLGFAVIVITFFLNLGYNPIAIAPHSVRHVSSWREAIIQNSDSLFGVVFSTNNDTIIPCCIPITIHIDTMLAKGNTPFAGSISIERHSSNSIFQNNLDTTNNNQSLIWCPISKKITGKIPVVSTLEEYLHKKVNNSLSVKSNLKDSIDYYAAKLFVEMRKANIKFMLDSTKYDSKTLKSLVVLNSLQNTALDRELKKFSLRDTIKFRGNVVDRDYMDILEDKHLVDFHCELSRSYLLCLIKDRADHLDMPAMFTLMNTFLLAYFTEVPSMGIRHTFNSNISMNLNDISYERSDTIKICSDDILGKRLFAWYNVFNSLCLMDISWNAKTFEENINSNLNNSLSRLEENTKTLQEIQNELSNIRQILQNGLKGILDGATSSNKSVSVLMDKLKNYFRTTDPKRYEDIYKRLDAISAADDIINTVEADKSFFHLKRKVLDSCLLVKMKEDDTNIYNNDFENICKLFITVSVFRCYNVGDNIKAYSEYIEKKDVLYNSVKKIDSCNNVVRQNRAKIERLSNESKQKLSDIIDVLRKREK